MSSRLKDKVLVVIGGTTGLGRSGVLACLREGASVVVVGRHRDSIARLEDDAGDFADQLRTVSADAQSPQTSATAIDLAVRSFGSFDGLYHVAGGSGRSLGDGPLHQITDDGWQATLQWNLTSVFYSNRAALQWWVEQKRSGSILNMSSALHGHPSPRHFATHAYATAKSAIVGMTQAAAARYAHQDIRINAVAAGLTATPMAQRAVGDPQIVQFVKRRQRLDGGRPGTPDDLDSAVVFFLSDESKFVTGQCLAVDGGWSVCDGDELP